MSLQVATAATNVVRDGHFETLSGVDTRTTLLEAAAINLLLRSQEYSNPAWTSTATVTADTSVAPDGTVTADTINDTSGAVLQSTLQAVTVPNDSLKYTFSTWLKQGTSQFAALAVVLSGGTGVSVGVVVDLTNGTITNATTGYTAPVRSSITAFANGWYRVSVTIANNTTGNTSASLQLYPAWAASLTGVSAVAATGSVIAWGAQHEAGEGPTSYFATTSASAARATDAFYLPFPYTPQAMTIYAKFVERGAAQQPGAGGVLGVCDASSGTPRATLFSNAAGYIAEHHNGSSSVFTAVMAIPALGDLVELRFTVSATGAVQLGQSINGAAETTTATSASLAFAAAWSAQRLYVGSIGLFPAANSYLAVKAMRGVQTLSTMRAA